MELNVAPWLAGYHGQVIDLNTFGIERGPGKPVLDLFDISRTLGGIERFGARTTSPYYVTDHALRVADLLKARGYSAWVQWLGLNHEGDEAFLGFDPPSPALGILPDLKAMKARAWRAFAIQHGMPEKLPQAVYDADLDLLVTEKRDLMAPCERPWHPALEARTRLPDRIVPLTQQAAMDAFVHCWNMLALEVGYWHWLAEFRHLAPGEYKMIDGEASYGPSRWSAQSGCFIAPEEL